MLRTDLQFPFGAVYFRKSNPPRDDWERDYGVAAADGLNIFRHWFMWGSIERAPGVFEWSDYDRQMDLAAANGIKTIVAELIHAVPDWAVRKFDHARQVRANGTRLSSNMGVSPATGGFSNNGGGAGALSLNCPEVKDAAGRFLKALAARYKDHPAMYGYDVWNECNYAADVDYSNYAKAAFRVWLQRKHGDLATLASKWNRYSYSEWEDVEPPTQMAPYPECIDWMQFRHENFYDQMQWRIDTIRGVDPHNMITAHGVSGAIPNMAANGCDDWLAASKVELYGFTSVPVGGVEEGAEVVEGEGGGGGAALDGFAGVGAEDLEGGRAAGGGCGEGGELAGATAKAEVAGGGETAEEVDQRGVRGGEEGGVGELGGLVGETGEVGGDGGAGGAGNEGQGGWRGLGSAEAWSQRGGSERGEEGASIDLGVPHGGMSLAEIEEAAVDGVVGAGDETGGGEQRKRASWAISSGSPMRPMGWLRERASNISCSRPG